MRQEFCKTGVKPPGTQQIGEVLGARGAQEWFKKHSPNLYPNFR